MLEVPLPSDTHRWILHVDMDAFYASIEERNQPALRQKALVVAHDPRTTGGKGVVTTANYVARQFGVHSAMPANEALRLVPKNLLVFKNPDFDTYRAVSDQIHQLFHQVTELIEPVALDEAYLDITANTDYPSKIALALHLQDRIRQATHLTSSFGLSYNKFLAKEASEYNKPQGRTVILPEQADTFLDRLAIGQFRGVGKKTEPKMTALGIASGADLRKFSQAQLIDLFGKAGLGLYAHVRGVDNRPVERRVAKSLGKERTYNPFLTTEDQVKKQLTLLADMVAQALKAKQLHGKSVVLKVRNAEFETLTRRITQEGYFQSSDSLYRAAYSLWQQLHINAPAIRLLGITATNLAPQQFENLDLPL